MPEICRFDGLIFKMFFKGAEHNPPHIHIYYGNYSVEISLIDLTILEGGLPKKQLSKTFEWMRKHQTELLDMWENESIRNLPPL